MKSTIFFKNKPSLIATSTVAGPKEGEGELGKFIENVSYDDTFGEETYEKAECKIITLAIENAMKNAKLDEKDINAIISGDLLNQIISSSFSARKFNVPYLGVYNACSTMTEALAIGSSLVDGGYFTNVIAATGSHFATAERQYRYPLELGAVRPPQAQWTVTGSGAVILSDIGSDLCVKAITTGKMVDLGVTDANNMGAAMAPAAADCIYAHFEDTGRKCDYYDAVITGDLGDVGSELLLEILNRQGMDIAKVHRDCGSMIFDNENQGTNAGGSGCGCSASVLCGYFLKEMARGALNKILLVCTGALMSPTTVQLGEDIVGIAHAVAIERK